MTAVPPEAVTAAAEVIGTVLFNEAPDEARVDGENVDLARRVLEAAAPLIAAAERERIRQLAQERHAQYPAEMSGTGIPVRWGWFADLLEDEP